MPRSAFRGLMPGSEQAPQPEQRPGRLANSVASHFGAMSTSARVSPQPATTDDESQTLEKVVLAIGLEDREAEDCPVRGDQGELDSQPRKERQRKVVDDHRGQSDPGESNHRAIEDATTGTALVQALRPLHEHKESVTIGDAYYTDEARLACTRTSCW